MNLFQKNDAYIDLLKRCLSAELYEESAWELAGNRTTNTFKRIINLVLKKKSMRLVRTRSFNLKLRENGLDHPLFGFTMIGKKRLDNIQFCVEKVLEKEIPGDFIETGVWRGGSIILMRALLKIHQITDRIVWAADSFEGMPKPDAKRSNNQKGNWDLSHMDYLAVSLEDVKKNLQKFGLLDSQVKFLKGWFHNILASAPIKHLAILRLDGDLYESTIDALNALYPKVNKGGYVIVDDYHSWPGCKRAITEFRENQGIKDKMIPIDNHAVFWRVG